MKKNQKKLSFYVQYPLGLSYLFTPGETRFIIHMIDIEFLKNQGYNTNWTRAEYMKRMGLNEYTFDHCVKKFVAMGLLSKRNNNLGNRVYYTFNVKLYNRLVDILSATANIDLLIGFCNKFKNDDRTIESITDDEISALKCKNSLVRKY